MNQDNRLKLNTKLFQKELFQKVMHVIQSGKSDSPFVIELDTTTICDFKCPGCISSNLLNSGSFKKDRLLSLCEEIIAVNVIAVILTGGGEPLLHPAIGDVIKKLAEADIEIGINTNGALIDKYLKYISKYVSWTRISVDAATPETYGKVRPHKSGSNMFNKVIDNLKLLSNEKKGSLGYSFLLMDRTDNNKIDSNYQEVFQAGILAKEMGCDYFELKPMYNMRHYLIPQSIDLIELLKNQLKKLKKIESSTFKVIYPRTLDTIKHQRKMIEIKNYNRCLISEPAIPARMIYP